jgi:hypothetical protein
MINSFARSEFALPVTSAVQAMAAPLIVLTTSAHSHDKHSCSQHRQSTRLLRASGDMRAE